MSSYFKVFSTIAKKLKGNKSKVSPTIKSVKPASGSLTKRRKDTEEVMKIRTRHGAAPNKRTSDTIKKISKLNDDLDKTRARKMGGGMMGRRMGYSEGTLKPVDPKKQKGLSKLPKQVRNKMGYMKKGGRV
jgi:phosphoenolpyruvate carboxylase